MQTAVPLSRRAPIPADAMSAPFHIQDSYVTATRIEISFYLFVQTHTLFCTMKLSSIALGAVAAVATLTGADASCSKTTFIALVEKAEDRGITLPSRSCMKQVFKQSCNDCENSFKCYAQKGQELAPGIPACERPRLRRRLNHGGDALDRKFQSWTDGFKWDEDTDALGGGSFFVEGGANGGGQNGGPNWNVNARYENNWDEDADNLGVSKRAQRYFDKVVPKSKKYFDKVVRL